MAREYKVLSTVISWPSGRAPFETIYFSPCLRSNGAYINNVFNKGGRMFGRVTVESIPFLKYTYSNGEDVILFKDREGRIFTARWLPYPKIFIVSWNGGYKKLSEEEFINFLNSDKFSLRIVEN